jgi:hypothetical protein
MSRVLSMRSQSMRIRHAFVVLIAATLLCSFGIAADAGALVSGPQAGSRLPSIFDPLPLNVTNAELPNYAGKKNDYIEQFGANPVVLVFGRKITDSLTNLMKQLDAEVGKNKAARLRSVVIMLSDDDKLERTLREFGKRQGIRRVSLAITPEDPKHYKLSQEADVTVVLYKLRKVEANHAFRKGELNDKAIAKILAAVSKLVSRED